MLSYDFCEQLEGCGGEVIIPLVCLGMPPPGVPDTSGKVAVKQETALPSASNKKEGEGSFTHDGSCKLSEDNLLSNSAAHASSFDVKLDSYCNFNSPYLEQW